MSTSNLNRDIRKMEEYCAKGSLPNQLANTVSNLAKAENRYFVAIAMQNQLDENDDYMRWARDCENSFRKRCLDLGASKLELAAIKERACCTNIGFVFINWGY